MKIKGNAYFLMLLLVALLVVISLSLSMQILASKLLPLIIGGFTLLLVSIQLVRELRKEKAPPEKAPIAAEQSSSSAVTKKTPSLAAQWRPYLIAGAWLGGYLGVIYLLGLTIATAVFVFAYLKLNGSRWFPSIIYSVVTTGIIYGIFQIALEIELYKGLLFTMFS